jgi:hypothetical protein
MYLIVLQQQQPRAAEGQAASVDDASHASASPRPSTGGGDSASGEDVAAGDPPSIPRNWWRRNRWEKVFDLQTTLNASAAEDADERVAADVARPTRSGSRWDEGAPAVDRGNMRVCLCVCLCVCVCVAHTLSLSLSLRCRTGSPFPPYTASSPGMYVCVYASRGFYTVHVIGR